MSWIKTASTSALAAGAILLSAGCSSKKDVAVAAKDDTIRRQEQSIASAEQSRAQADANARVAEENAQRATELNRQLAASNDQMVTRTSAQMEALNGNTQRVASLQGKIDELEGIVRNMGPGVAVAPHNTPVGPNQMGNVTRDEKGGIHIRVAGSVMFEPGRAELKPGSHDTLMRACAAIRAQYPNNAIRIEGHTDSTPVVHSRDKFADNMALSQARAASVFDFMVKRGGISQSRMYTAGYGDRQPLRSPERTAADRAMNRRVEIVILPTNLNVHKEQMAQASGSAKAYRASATPASISQK